MRFYAGYASWKTSVQVGNFLQIITRTQPWYVSIVGNLEDAKLYAYNKVILANLTGSEFFVDLIEVPEYEIRRVLEGNKDANG